MITKKKIMQDGERVKINLIELRDYLSNKYERLSPEEKVILFKINSCLFRDEKGFCQYEDGQKI